MYVINCKNNSMKLMTQIHRFQHTIMSRSQVFTFLNNILFYNIRTSTVNWPNTTTKNKLTKTPKYSCTITEGLNENRFPSLCRFIQSSEYTKSDRPIYHTLLLNVRYYVYLNPLAGGAVFVVKRSKHLLLFFWSSF